MRSSSRAVKSDLDAIKIGSRAILELSWLVWGPSWRAKSLYFLSCFEVVLTYTFSTFWTKDRLLSHLGAQLAAFWAPKRGPRAAKRGPSLAEERPRAAPRPSSLGPRGSKSGSEASRCSCIPDCRHLKEARRGFKEAKSDSDRLKSGCKVILELSSAVWGPS